EFVLRWKIDNMGEVLGRGKVSKQVNEGGFAWTASIQRGKKIDRLFSEKIVTLMCDYERRGEWSCEAEIEFTEDVECEHNSKFGMHYNQGLVTFDNDNRAMEIKVPYPHGFFNSAEHSKATLLFSTAIKNSKIPPIIDLTKFCSPNEMGNVTLVFGDKKLQVSKEYLAIHSPVFAAMFYGDFAEKDGKEVEIKDVDYEEFIDLLQFIFLRSLVISDRYVPSLLMLADRFQMECVVNESEDHLIHTTGFDFTAKLFLADQYRLPALRDQCCKNLTSLTKKSLKKLK
ncbi:hypothetical protein PMAYCL1PPCAC_25426, partial [Pristionchus mayeri]